MSFGLKLPLNDASDSTINVREYQSHIGSVMYAMLSTRPNIGYSITMLSQYSSNPGRQHWIAINWLLRLNSYMMVISKLMIILGIRTLIGQEIREIIGLSQDLLLSWPGLLLAGAQRSNCPSHFQALKASIWQSLMLLKKPFGYSSFYKTSISLYLILQLFSSVMTCSQPLHTDIPQSMHRSFPCARTFFWSVIECTATDHVVFPRLYIY